MDDEHSWSVRTTQEFFATSADAANVPEELQLRSLCVFLVNRVPPEILRETAENLWAEIEVHHALMLASSANFCEESPIEVELEPAEVREFMGFPED